MQLVIEIPEETYNKIRRLQDGYTDYQTTLMLYDAVKIGTPLPKSHGRLIDADALIGEPYLMSEGNGMYRTVIGYFRVEDAPTIIEGTEGEE